MVTRLATLRLPRLAWIAYALGRDTKDLLIGEAADPELRLDIISIISSYDEVDGVVDMLTAPQLERAVRVALDQKPAGLVIDFTDVDFLASAGMGVIVAVHEEIGSEMRFCIVADGPATSRPLKLVGIADIMPLHATLDEALATFTA